MLEPAQRRKRLMERNQRLEEGWWKCVCGGCVLPHQEYVTLKLLTHRKSVCPQNLEKFLDASAFSLR